MCAKCLSVVDAKQVWLPSFFYITRRGAVAILRQLQLIDEDEVKNLWINLKSQWDSILLPTGAKLFRDREGNIGVYSYAWDRSDITPYRVYEIQEI